MRSRRGFYRIAVYLKSLAQVSICVGLAACSIPSQKDTTAAGDGGVLQPVNGGDGGMSGRDGGTIGVDGGTSGEDGGTSVGDSGTTGGSGAFFIDNGPNDEGGGVVTIDAQGGMHVLHSGGGYGVPCGGPVRYGHCVSGCDQAASWTFTDAPNAPASCDGTTGEVNAMLAVDGRGNPRILTTQGTNSASYSELGPSGWTAVSIPTTAPLGNPKAYVVAGRHYFAVSASGTVAFAYSDSKRGLI
jgi:hypothetical protein